MADNSIHSHGAPHIVVYKPGIARRETAFEAMVDIYRTLATEGTMRFTLVCAGDDEPPAFPGPVVRLPPYRWRPMTKGVPLLNPLAVQALRRIARHASHIVAPDPTIYDAGLTAAAITGVRLYFDTSVTSFGDARTWLRWTLRMRAARRALNRADGLLMTTDACLERLGSLGVLTPKLSGGAHVVGHPVADAAFCATRPSERDKRVVIASRLEPEKGVQYIIAALINNLTRNPDFTAAVVGHGPLHTYLSRVVQDSGLGDRITFLGRIPRDDLLTLLTRSRIYVSHAVSTPQWEEYFGVANLEAMAAGCASVICRSGAIPLVIRDRTAVLDAEPRDGGSVEEHIESLIASPDLCDQLSSQGRAYVATHNALGPTSERFRRAVLQS